MNATTPDILATGHILRLQRLVGNQAVTAQLRLMARPVIQRAPTVTAPPRKPALVKRPEDTVTYEEWLASFASLSTFTAVDTAPDQRGDIPRLGSMHQVFGDPKQVASHDDNAPAEQKQADPLFQTKEQKFADHFIDHPTDRWVREHLPDELVETAYRLPTDCADIVVILRHVWLFVHHRTEKHGNWVLGVGAGTTLAQRQKNLNQVIKEVTSHNVATLVNPYVDKDGKQLLGFAELQKVLHPGDILVWEHRKRTRAGFQRTGGHSQTHTKNPAGKGGRDPLRDQPGRRIERGTLSGSSRLRDSSEGVWTWDLDTDHPTVLVADGPAASARRGGGAKPSQRALGYPGLHKTLENDLNDRLNALAGSSGLSPTIFDKLKTHYAVIGVASPGKPAPHDTMVGHGDLLDALKQAPSHD